MKTPTEKKQHAEAVAKAEASFAHLQAELTAIAEKIRANPNADGWVRLCEILDEARQDKRIASSCGASSFLELMLELASDSLTAANEREALEPLAVVFKLEGRSELARKGGMAKTESDPKQAELELVKQCWEAWQSKPENYKNNTAFATDMLLKFLQDDTKEQSKHLSSLKVITSYCTKWAKEVKK